MVMGRPRLFKSVEEFIELSEAYFEGNDGGKISWTGLCLAVGAHSRHSLDRYKKGEHGQDFVSPVKKALMIVENYYEEKAEGAKAIFALKNFDWKDKNETELTGKDGGALETKSTVEAGPGISEVLSKLAEATTTRPVDSDEGGDQE